MQIVEASDVSQQLTFNTLIPALKAAFAKPFTMPKRQVLALAPELAQDHSAFALLPSWNDEVIANKMFTYFPDNPQKSAELASLYSKIMLFSRITGEPLALVDGTSITYWRTAAISALASSFLSRENSQQLVLFGTGNLAPYLIKAHLTVRQLSQITLVARDISKANHMIEQMANHYPEVTFNTCRLADTEQVKQQVAQADIICCATGSHIPLFDGDWLKLGAHVDCLGNHHANARECDSITVTRANVYVDSLANTLAEAGELLIPIAQGEFSADAICGELAQLCQNSVQGRANEQQITLFKSVGTAYSDLVAANLVYQQLSRYKNQK